jgi:thiol-disulfide isomerase/thioredoxin
MPYKLLCCFLSFFTFSVFSFAQTSPSAQKSQLNGYIDGYTGEIKYKYSKNDSLLREGNAKAVNGRFLIDNLNALGLLEISLAKPSTSFSFFTDTTNMSLVIHLDSFTVEKQKVYNLKNYTVTGSKYENIYAKFYEDLKDIYALKSNDSAIASKLYKKLSSFSGEYPGSLYVADALVESDALTYAQAKSVYENFSAQQKSRAMVRGVDSFLDRLQKTEIGSQFVYFPQKDSTGNTVKSLSDINFKYLFVDFWASNCGPCRKEHPALIKLYNSYKDKGFEIMSVSLDYSKKPWVEAIKKDGIPWYNVSDLLGIQNKIAQYYSISYIPFNLLLNDKFEIVGKNLSPEMLDAKIFAMLNK